MKRIPTRKEKGMLRFAVLLLLLAVGLVLLASCCQPAPTTVEISAGTVKPSGQDTPSTTHEHEWSAWQIIETPTCMGVGSQEKYCACGVTYTDVIQPTGHSFGEWETVEKATCTAPGLMKRVCHCGQYESKTTPLTGHSYTALVVKPTCEERGYTLYTCDCKNSYKDLYTESFGHSFGEWVVVKEATATEPGEKIRTCFCGVSESGVIPVGQHNYTAAVTEPTCEKEGYTTFTCTICGDVYLDLFVQAKGHAFGAWETVTEPTCTESGYREQSCDCGKTVGEEVAAKGHEYLSSVTPASCTKDGYAYRQCLVCAYETVEVLYATGHTVSFYHEYTEPTCNEKGSASGYCEVCGEFVTESLSALGHSASELIFTDKTCGDQKLGYILCTVCEEEIASFGHTYTETVVKATCEQDGKKIFTCTHCGGSYEEAIAKNGHYAGEWVVLQAPTCIEAGEKQRHCTVCSSLAESAPIEPIGHSYESGAVSGGVRYTCTLCSDSYLVETEDYITIQFMCGQDKVCRDLQMKKGTAPMLPMPEKEHFVFDGWYLNAELTDKCLDSYLFEADTVLYGAWREANLSGTAATNNLFSNAPIDFTFAVKSTVALSDENLARYVFVEDLYENAPAIRILSSQDGVYTIGCDEYEPGMNYRVLLREEVCFADSTERELWFTVEKENSHHAVFRDDLIFISESDVYGCFEDAEKLYIFLAKDTLDAGDRAVIYRDEIENILLTVEILAEGQLESLYAYQIEAAEFDAVFEEYELHYSGEVDLEDMDFDENLQDILVEEIKASSVYTSFRRAATTFAGIEHGKYYYDENGTKVKPSVKVEGNKILFAVELVTDFARMHVETHKVESLFTITLAVELEVALDFTMDVYSADHFTFAVEVDTTAKANIFASAKNEKDTKDLAFFKKLYEEAQKDGAFSEVDSEKASSSKEVPIGSIPFHFWGVSFRFTVYNIFDFEAVGEAGVGSEVNTTVEIGLRKSGEHFSQIRSFDSSARITFYMMGKVEISNSLKFEFSVSLLGIVNTYVNASVGPYFEMGGILSASFSSTGVHSYVASGYIAMGVKVDAKVGANAKLDVWSLFGKKHTITLYEEEWTVYSNKFELLSLGTKEIPLYFEEPKESKDLESACGGDLALSTLVDTKAVIQNFATMKKESKTLDCKYYLNGTYACVTLTEDGILTATEGASGQTIEIKVVCGSVYKLLELTLTITHDVVTVEDTPPTCTEDGHTAATYCRGCETVIAGEYIKYPALGHSYETVAVAPTCYERGYTMQTCSVCDRFVIDTTTYSLPNDHVDDGSGICSSCGEACGHYHAFSEKVALDTCFVSAADCTTPARYYYSCSCGAIGIEIFDDKPLGHDDPDKDGNCDVCGRRVDGLFDAEGNLLASWYELVYVYGMNVTKDFDSYSYKRYTNSPYYVLTNTKELAGGVKLVIGDVERIGSNTFRSCTTLVEVILPDSLTTIASYAFYFSNIQSITIPSSVTCIESYAFDFCSKMQRLYISDLEAWCALEFSSETCHPLNYSYSGKMYLNGELITELVIPNGTETVGDYLFYHCYGITNVVFPNSVTSIGQWAFSGCEDLTDLLLPSSLKDIGASAFYGCKKLESVTIPSGVMSLGQDAFAWCNSLTNIYITDLAAWCQLPFDPYSVNNPLDPSRDAEKKLYLNGNLITELVIPDGITTIPYAAFANCTSITHVTIPSSVTVIDAWAFQNCTGLVSVSLPREMTSIGSAAFVNCTSLTSIVIPNGITELHKTFYDCKNLTSVTIPSSITYLGYSTFAGCTNLTDVYITDLAAWCGIEFASYDASPLSPNMGAAKRLYLNGELITELVIPEGVSKLPGGAFANCTSITSVTIPSSVTEIYDRVFYHCTGLLSVTVPGSLTYLGSQVFESCGNLTDVTVSAGAKEIGYYMFGECKKLTTVQIPASVTLIDNKAFYNCRSLTTIVFEGTVEEWNALAKGSSWNYKVPATEVQCSDGMAAL